ENWCCAAYAAFRALSSWRRMVACWFMALSIQGKLRCTFDVLQRCSLAWIISANRILSEIFAVTDGEGLISSRFSRTAAIKDAAMRIAAFCRFSLLLGLFEVFSIFRRSGQVLLGDG